MLVELTKRTRQSLKIKVADIGVGTGNLSIMLLESS